MSDAFNNLFEQSKRIAAERDALRERLAEVQVRWEACDRLEKARTAELIKTIERLAEAEALLLENCGQIPQPLGWFERVRMFLGITAKETAP